MNFDRNEYNSADIHDNTIMLFNALDKSVNDLINDKQVTLTYSKKWFGPELRELMRKEGMLHKRAQILNDKTSWMEYRRVRNEYNRKLRAAKNNEIKNVLS